MITPNCLRPAAVRAGFTLTLLCAASALAAQQPPQSISVETMGCVVQSGRARCFGWGPFMANNSGQTLHDSDVLQPLGGDPGLVSIRTDNINACGLTAEGAMYCIGQTDPNTGPFTQETPGLDSCGGVDCSARLVPVAAGIAFRSFAMHDRRVCGSTLDGRLACWGRAPGRQNGRRPRMIAGAPPFVEIEGAREGDGETSDFCGLTAAGRIWCWKLAPAGKLSPVGPAPRPRALSGAWVFTSLSVGSDQVCGLTADGAMWCWAGAAENPTGSPVRMHESYRFRRMSLGDKFGCGITMEGPTVCWGDNMVGNLGTGSDGAHLRESAVPLPVATQALFVDISAGGELVGAITSDGQAYRWGGCYCSGYGAAPTYVYAPTLLPVDEGPPRGGATPPQAAPAATPATPIPSSPPLGKRKSPPKP